MPLADKAVAPLNKASISAAIVLTVFPVNIPTVVRNGTATRLLLLAISIAAYLVTSPDALIVPVAETLVKPVEVKVGTKS